MMISTSGMWSFLGQALNTVKAVRFPLNLIAFVLVLCTAIITFTTALTEDENFKYAIHTLLGVMGAFFVTSWFCPKSLYYPEDLIDLKKNEIDIKHEPGKAVWVCFIGVAIYMAYQLIKLKYFGPESPED